MQTEEYLGQKEGSQGIQGILGRCRDETLQTQTTKVDGRFPVAYETLGKRKSSAEDIDAVDCFMSCSYAMY
jgi:hypothetical protein